MTGPASFGREPLQSLLLNAHVWVCEASMRHIHIGENSAGAACPRLLQAQARRVS